MLPVLYTGLAGLLLLPLLLTCCCPYLLQDVRFFLQLANMARQVRSYRQRRPVRTILHVFLEQARKTPHKPFLLFRDETLTYAQVDRRSNQVARALHDHLGLRQGDCVALFMGNEPAYVWLWLGLLKLGCPMACLNYNIRAKSLLHCFQCCGAKVLLASPELQEAVEEVLPTLKKEGVIALLEMSLPVTHPVVRNALFCLDTAWKSARGGAGGSHVYTKALLAYAFALAGNQDTKKEILKSLDEEAVKEEDSVHWTRPQKPSASVGLWYQPQAPSAEVEMTAYVLLAYLTTEPAPTQEDLTAAMLIVKWLTKQQNSHGGFSSTQDTVVALHALSKYGSATFTRAKKAAQVTIRSSGAFSTKFQVNNNNQLLLQRVTLPTVPGDYTMKVTGEGCVYLQTSLKYSVLPREEEFPFAVVVQTLPGTCEDPKAHTSFQISLNISYTGSRSESNMAIADVKMVSGFIPLKPTVKMLERSVHVSRTEVSNNHVLIYLDKVSNQTVNLSFTVQQDIPIRDLKSAVVKVYDYYEKDEFAVAKYSAPCSADYGNA